MACSTRLLKPIALKSGSLSWPSLAQLAPLTLRAAKETVRRILEHSRPEDFDDLILSCYMSEDFKEGVAAFLDKRPPVWRGRRPLDACPRR